MTSKTADLAPHALREVIHHAAQACSQTCIPPLLRTARLSGYIIHDHRILVSTRDQKDEKAQCRRAFGLPRWA